MAQTDAAREALGDVRRRPGAGARRGGASGALTGGARAARTIALSLAVALGLAAVACLLPDDPYQRWQLADRPLFATLPWAYERIHFDDRPIDVVVIGPSRTFNGVSPTEIEQRLSRPDAPVRVANFSMPGEGRNLQWAILDETFKAKQPGVVVVGVDEPRAEFGHGEFKKIAPAGAILAPPAPLLHDYFYDLGYLPVRQVRLAFARLFPGLAGLRDRFDPQAYAATKSDFSTGRFVVEGKRVDMEAELPAGALDALPLPASANSFVTGLLVRCCNEGDDRVYLRQIVALAKKRGARLMFVFMPSYRDPARLSDGDWLARQGDVIDNSDLSADPALYYNRTHMNHAGARIVSERIAARIAGEDVLGRSR